MLVAPLLSLAQLEALFYGMPKQKSGKQRKYAICKLVLLTYIMTLKKKSQAISRVFPFYLWSQDMHSFLLTTRRV